jgi:alkylhydroperoxidase/carboxymuconolactone decarboxylase family protein YurZ
MTKILLIVTLAALIARNQTVEMAYYLNVALDNGVKPAEISEMITRLLHHSALDIGMAPAHLVTRSTPATPCVS